MLEVVVLLCLAGQPDQCVERAMAFTGIASQESCQSMARSYAGALASEELAGYELRWHDCGVAFDTSDNLPQQTTNKMH